MTKVVKALKRKAKIVALANISAPLPSKKLKFRDQAPIVVAEESYVNIDLTSKSPSVVNPDSFGHKTQK